MDWPYQFPHPADVIAAEAQRYRRMSVEQRLNRLIAMVDAGQGLLSTSQRQKHQQLKARLEEQWISALMKVAVDHEC